MKLSGIGMAFVAATFISASSLASAQQFGATGDSTIQLDRVNPTDSPAVSEQESADNTADPIIARILHFEPPVVLDEFTAKATLNLSVASSEQSEDGPAESEFIFSDLNPEDQAYLQRLQDINSYEQALEQLEFEGGAWSEQIAEELTTLGTLMQEQGDYEESLEIFDRAIHIRRVNEGLFSPRQVPLVEQLVGSYVALQQWEEADEQQQYAFYVQMRTYGPNDARMIDVFQNLAQWNIKTFYRGIDPDPSQRLMQTFELYRAAANTVVAHFGARDPRYVEFLQDMAGASDMVTRYSLPDPGEVAHLNPSIRNVTADYGGRSNRVPDDNGGGERALSRIVDFYSNPKLPQNSQTLLLRVQSIANLGDWYLLRRQQQVAMRAYEEAYNLLSGAEDGEALIQETFDKIVFLPTYSTFAEEKKEALRLNPDSGAHMGYIDMSFDVTQYGRANNFETLAMEPAGLERVEGQVVEMVRNNFVRPRISGGKAISSAGERYRFAFWY